MNKGDIKFYKFVESLGTLKLCAVSASEAASIKDGAKIVMSDINFEYGTHTYYSVELLSGTKGTDIKLGDYTFSYLVSVKTDYIRSYNSYNVYTSLAFLTPTGEVVENNAIKIHGTPDDGRILYDVKLLMCLISVIGYTDDFFPMWNTLFHSGSQKKEYLYKYADGLKQVIEKYPLMKGYLRKTLLASCEQDAEMKEEIDKLL